MRENEFLKQQVSDLKTNLDINKQLLKSLESSTTLEYGQCGGQPVDLSNGSLEQKFEGYQRREDALVVQVEQLRAQRDKAMAEILIMQQMLLDVKA